MQSAETKTSRFYKEYWFWLVMAPIFSSVVVGTSFVITSFKTFDGVVVDNYYKDGKGFQVRYEEDRLAVANHLQATLVKSDSQIKIQLSGEISSFPDSLNLIFIYPTSDQFDIELIAQHIGNGVYQTSINDQVTNHFYLVQLYTPEQVSPAWRLHGETDLPLRKPLVLKPKRR